MSAVGVPPICLFHIPKRFCEIESSVNQVSALEATVVHIRLKAFPSQP